MSDIDKKRDAILEGLYFYYNQFSYSNEIFRFTGDKEDLVNEFIPAQLLSAWLAFSKKGDVRSLDSAKLSDFLDHLEKENLVISKDTEQGKMFKIQPDGISLLEKKGYVGKNKRLKWEYCLKWLALGISLLSLVVSTIALIIAALKK